MGKLKQQTIGERLRILREHYKSRGLTAKTLSEIAGISPMQLNNIENDKVKHVSYDFIKSVADGLGSTIDWIENGTGEMLPNGEVEIKANSNKESELDNPYRDYLIQKLEADTLKWEKMYNTLLEKVMSSMSLGKLNGYPLTAKGHKRAILLGN